MYENRKFVIFSVTELDLVDFSQVLETSAQTVRKSVDGTLTFVKYDGDMPPSVGPLTTKSVEYGYTEMINILQGPDWTDPSQQDL
ncbi:MAG: hypothetical protein EBY80_14240 [Actinobacteria bacterium]|nr:hypothetical protein [Actinomycetota bacterium]